MAAYTILECVDFSQFQETLKKMRLLDDTIVYALNTQLPTESFKAQQDCQVTCKNIYSQLESNFKTREEAFNKCLEYSRNKVMDLKTRRDQETNNPIVQKDLRKEQSKVRFLETELAVDDVIRSRTKKVFYERCRIHFLPDNFSV